MARTTSYTSPRSRGGLPHNSIMIITFFLLQFTTLASAGVVFTNDEYVVRPNEPFTINWEGNRGPVTLTLMRGPDIDLQAVMVIASGLSGTKYTWTPPPTLKTDGYELQIEDGVSTDYSPRFQYPAPPDPSTAFTPTPAAPTTFATSLTVGGTIATSNPAATTTSSSSSDAASQTDGLSTGAKIGIAVGASILGLVLLALLMWFIYNRGKKAGSNNQSNNPNMAEGGQGGRGPVGGYYAPSGTGTFDQDTVVGSNASKSPWAGSLAAARATTPFAELGQPEYTPRELWAGGIYQGPPPPGTSDGSKGMVNVQERAYSVPLPIQHPVPDQGQSGSVPPGYEQYQDQIQQQQRIQDDWHAVISPASRSGTGVTSNVTGAGGTAAGMAGPGGFDFGTSPVSVTSSPPPMGYSATVTAGGPPSTPPPGLGRYARDASDGSPLSFSARVHDEEYTHTRAGSRGASRGGY